jgi:hypothetical protein
MNLTFKHSGKEGGKKEDIIITEKNCTIFKYRFSKVKTCLISIFKYRFYIKCILKFRVSKVKPSSTADSSNHIFYQLTPSSYEIIQCVCRSIFTGTV